MQFSPEYADEWNTYADDSILRWHRRVRSQGYYAGQDFLPTEECFLNVMCLSLWLSGSDDEDGETGGGGSCHR